MARRFQLGGRLLVVGTGLSTADAHHVAVEFVHPVTVGNRSLPALAVDVGVLPIMAQPPDMVMFVAVGPTNLAETVEQAGKQGLLTVALTGPEPLPAHHALHVDASDPLVIRELHVTAYHIMWELVHVFLKAVPTHCTTCSDEVEEMEIVEHLPGGLARVRSATGEQEISIELVDAAVGARVRVHAGVALGVCHG
jgi:D-sedoheptulose 7-phosphate isomerase